MDQTDREELVANLLNEARISSQENESYVSDSGVDGEQVEEEIPQLNELSTPVSLQQARRDDENVEKKKKKKKKKKSKTSKLPEAGTDLADDYVEQNNEDVIEDPFSPEHPLAQRVEYAIWKYRKNHKFTESRKAIFDNYLKFGGIVTGPNMFLGRSTSADTPDDPEAVQDFEAAKIATDFVPDELEDGLEVNFTEVAQVYFGNTFIRESLFIGLQDFTDAPVLIDAFLRYLQIRNVAPEYADDIANARAICAEAKIQLPKCKRAIGLLPGKYNLACSNLFQEKVDTSWMTSETLTVQKRFLSFVVDTLGSSDEDSRKTVQKQIKNPENVKLLDTETYVFVEIAKFSAFDENTDKDDLILVTLQNKEDDQKSYEIYLEKEIVDFLLVGMVFRADLVRLSNDGWYLEKARRLMPTFYMEDTCMTDDDYEF
ncbi:Argonaute siRNA chaperone complex subunit Arb1-domain-containing protein [Parasitella parasitica]|nr:Argonaute siRNA chaperone complex subunit Arb1-domain-containing protein [Parasitella parasitica]